MTDTLIAPAQHDTTGDPEVTVYTRPSCVQCNGTFRLLDRAGVNYQKVNLPDDPEALELVRALGHMQAPVVIVRTPGQDDTHWSGLNPDKIKQHITGLN